MFRSPPPFHARFTGDETGAQQGNNRTVDVRQRTPQGLAAVPAGGGRARPLTAISAARLEAAARPAGPGQCTQHDKRRRCDGRRRVRRARAGFKIDHSEPQARVWRSRERPGPTALGTPAAPQATKTPEPQWVPGLAAEDGGFEPPRACTQHAFQACAIGH